MDYSVCAWREHHYLSLEGETLIYRFDKSPTEYPIDLSEGIVSLKRHTQTHRQFRAGIPLIFIPIVVMGQFYFKEGENFSHEPQFFLLYACLVAGLVMVIRYRTIYRACTMITKTGLEVLILCDKEKPAEFERFIAELERINADQKG